MNRGRRYETPTWACKFVWKCHYSDAMTLATKHNANTKANIPYYSEIPRSIRNTMLIPKYAVIVHVENLSSSTTNFNGNIYSVSARESSSGFFDWPHINSTNCIIIDKGSRSLKEIPRSKILQRSWSLRFWSQACATKYQSLIFLLLDVDAQAAASKQLWVETKISGTKRPETKFVRIKTSRTQARA